MDTIPTTAIRYIKSETEPITQQLWSLRSALQPDPSSLSRSQMVYTVNEMSKSVLNWIGKGLEQQLGDFAQELDRFLSSDPELDAPLQGISQKRKFGANLAFLLELINVYRHSDLELKDYHQIMMEGKVSNRLRKVLLAFFKENRGLNAGDLFRIVYDNEQEFPETLSEKCRKLIQRDLDTLLEQGLIQRIVVSPRKFVYEATPRAYAYKDDVMQRELGVSEYLITQKPILVEVGQLSELVSGVPSNTLHYQQQNT